MGLIKLLNKVIINLDFDGVLIPNDNFEKTLVERLSGRSLTNKISHFEPDVFNWYVDMVNASPLAPLNISLLKYLEENRNKFVLRLWTNRNRGVMRRTLDNLGRFKSIFDSFRFYEGDKINSRVEGIVIDNDPKYLKCGEFGIHYEWKGGLYHVD